MAFGASAVETASRTSGRLDHLAGLQAPRTDAQAADAAVHHRTDPLEVRFEPPGGDVVRVADIPPDNRAFSAKFAAFRHDRAYGRGKR